MTKLSPQIIHIDACFYSKELADMLLRHKARTWSNTLGEVNCNIRYGNGGEVLNELLKYGVNTIQTNEPELLLQLLRYKGLYQ